MQTLSPMRESDVISRFEFTDYPESVFDLTDNANIQHSYDEVMMMMARMMSLMMMTMTMTMTMTMEEGRR